MRTNVPSAMRALRHRRAWRQEDLGRRAGLSRDAVSRVESGQLRGLTLGSLARLVEAVDATLSVEVRWQGADLDRLIDRDHAALQNAAARRLGELGWIARAEVSFNHYGDRGRCDLLAWHPATRTILIVEVKSRLGDIQDTLGRLDVKARLGGLLAEQVGWGAAALVVPAFVLADSWSVRRVLMRHESLFHRYGVRGRTALAWLRSPQLASGIVWFERSDSDEGRGISRQRVRKVPPAG